MNRQAGVGSCAWLAGGIGGHRIRWAPETGGGDGGSDLLGFGAAPNPAASPAGATTPAGQPAGPAGNSPPAHNRYVEHQGQRIEVAEQFWDPTANAGAGGLNAIAALKAATDLRRQVSAMPKAPDKYEVRAPATFKDRFEIKADDPLAAGVMEVAKKAGIPQQAFDELVGVYVQNQVAAAEAEQKAFAEEIAADTKKLTEALGTDARAKVQDLDKWLGAQIGDSEAHRAAVMDLRMTAHGTLFLMHLRSQMGSQPVASGKDVTAPPARSRMDLQRIMADPRYWRDKDPVFLKQVEDGFKALNARR